MKTYLSIIRDHSGSMSSIARAAARDYNATLAGTKAAAELNNIETLVSTYKCGGNVQREVLMAPIASIPAMPEASYGASGGTPLFGSVLQAIADLENSPDMADPEATFIVMATTDGDATDQGLRQQMMNKIRQLELTDRWTFVFRVPRGAARGLASSGIQAGNILEWETTERGAAAASQANTQAMSEFYTNRAAGVKSSKTFYTSVANLTAEEVKAALGDISQEVSLLPVAVADDGKQIRDFVEERLAGQPMLKGAAFYQLVKTEDKIQDYKLIAIREKATGQIFCGPEARDMIGLPRVGDVRVRPETSGAFDVFVQSTSVNRKVTANTSLMYWPGVGKRFTEGKSSR